MTATAALLLSGEDPPPLEIFQAGADSRFLISCDHAGCLLPEKLGSLGLGPEELRAHIAWDLGAADFARNLAHKLGAPLFLQRYSRLVIDCNRPLDAGDSIPLTSGGISIPGNEGLDPVARAARSDEIFRPYHAAIARELAERDAAGRQTILVLAHSFTPELLGVARPWHTGILYNRDRRMAGALLALLGQEAGLVVGDNQPYFISDNSDYAANVYGERAGRPYAELEIRQDLLADVTGQDEWAERYERLLVEAAARLVD